MKTTNIRNQAPVPMQDCGMCAATTVLSDKWTLLIIREAFYGVVRFEDMISDIKIPRAVLSGRLKSLVEHGILLKKAYQEESARPRSAYVLSEKGRELAPVFIAMMQWGNKHYLNGKAAISIIDKVNQKPVTLALISEASTNKRYDTSELDFTINDD